MSDTLFQVSGLQCMAGYRPLFTGLELSVQSGQWIMLTGPNGTGKTTLLRAIAGLVRPTDGQILWHGKPVQTSHQQWRREIHYLGHQSAIKDDLSAADNLSLLLELDHGRKPDASRVAELMTQVGLFEKQMLPCSKLSAGQRRRIQLARLMDCHRPMWLLDEPGNALDKDGDALLGAMLSRHLEAGGLAIVATHQPVSSTHQPIPLDIGEFRAQQESAR